ncbi:MAG: hypothetical protein ACYC6Y_18870 [Thermoguttaceae bacterium]
MSENAKLNKPWMVAVWPGMGHVAISAGYYLMAKLTELFTAMQRAIHSDSPTADEPDSPLSAELPEDPIAKENQRRIETLFHQARQDRSKAYELKRELDHLGVFKDYEDRFLDLFKKPE